MAIVKKIGRELAHPRIESESYLENAPKYPLVPPAAELPRQGEDSRPESQAFKFRMNIRLRPYYRVHPVSIVAYCAAFSSRIRQNNVS